MRLLEQLTRFFLCLNCLAQITTLSVLHDDLKFVLFGSVDLDKLYYKRMVAISENLSLFDSLLSLLRVHMVDADLLNDQKLTSLSLSDQISLAKSSFSE